MAEARGRDAFRGRGELATWCAIFNAAAILTWEAGVSEHRQAFQDTSYGLVEEPIILKETVRITILAYKELQLCHLFKSSFHL